MKKWILAVMVFWLAIVGIAFWWNLADENRENQRLALETARAFFQQVVTTRLWNAGFGGVYVPVSHELQPNPYLDDPLRDLVTEQGITLTKINPAYMTRQIAEIASLHNGIKFHITSLNPIRPGNKPTEWEKAWLQRFEQGEKELGGFIQEGSTSFFRYMAPLKVEESCLKCHARQGYHLGDIRGGISITLPYISEKKNTALWAGYGITALVGVFLIFIGGSILEKKREQLLLSNETLQQGIRERETLIDHLREANNQIKTLCGIVPICMYCKEIRDDQGYWNQLEQFISEHTLAQFSHGICPKCMKEKHPEITIDE